MNVEVTLNLPDDLVSQARAEGILNDEHVTALLKAELERKQRVRTLFIDIEQLHHLEPPITEAEIEDELRAYRSEKVGKRMQGDS